MSEQSLDAARCITQIERTRVGDFLCLEDAVKLEDCNASHVRSGRAKPALKNTVAAIGIFDGVHKGHQHLIRRMVASPAGENLKSIVGFILSGGSAASQESRLSGSASPEAGNVKKLGVDIVMVIRFTDNFPVCALRNSVAEISRAGWAFRRFCW